MDWSNHKLFCEKIAKGDAATFENSVASTVAANGQEDDYNSCNQNGIKQQEDDKQCDDQIATELADIKLST